LLSLWVLDVNAGYTTFVNAVPGNWPVDVDVYINGHLKFKGIQYKQFEQIFWLYPSGYHIKITWSNQPPWANHVLMKNCSTEPNRDMLLVLHGSPDHHSEFPYELSCAVYTGQNPPEGQASFGFFHAAIAGVNLDMRVPNEGPFSYRNIVYGRMASYPSQFLSIKAGNYPEITFFGIETTPAHMPLFRRQHDFASKSVTLIMAVGLIGDPSVEFFLDTLYVPLENGMTKTGEMTT